MGYLDQLLIELANREGASDLFLSAGEPPYMRLSRKMVKMGETPLSQEQVQNIIFEGLTEKQKKQFQDTWELDCAYSLGNIGRFRVNVFWQQRGLSAVYRIIPAQPLSLKQLDLPNQIVDLVQKSHGLILVVGSTGSGKSTTLSAMINEINQTKEKHIITLEDPIEVVHKSAKSLVQQRELGGHVKGFPQGLRSALRENPDIILVGEMRDLETISLSITAAETGHLVFGTLHVGRAHKTVNRIIDVFPASQQAQIRTMLAGNLHCVIAQSLVPKIGGGMTATVEILVNTFALSNIIREGKTAQMTSVMQTGQKDGMISFDTHIKQRVQQGLVEEVEAKRFLSSLEGFKSEEKNQKSLSSDSIQKNKYSFVPPKPPPSSEAVGQYRKNQSSFSHSPQKDSVSSFLNKLNQKKKLD